MQRGLSHSILHKITFPPIYNMVVLFINAFSMYSLILYSGYIFRSFQGFALKRAPKHIAVLESAHKISSSHSFRAAVVFFPLGSTFWFVGVWEDKLGCEAAARYFNEVRKV